MSFGSEGTQKLTEAMCADKVVRFIKKCLRGEESTAKSIVFESSSTSENARQINQYQQTTGSSPTDHNGRLRRTPGKTERRKRRALPDVLQSQNICSITSSKFVKDQYGPLLDFSHCNTFQSQANIYSDTKGSGQQQCHQLPYRNHSQTHQHQHEQLRTNLQQHLPHHHQMTPASSAADAAATQSFSQKHLHHLFPVSVQRSMDGEEGSWTKSRCGLSSSDNKMTGPPPNRTICS